MKKLLVLLCFIQIQGYAQQIFPTVSEDKKEGDAVYHVQLNEAVVVDSRLFKNDTLRYNYNQMKHYVSMILPYLDVAVKMFNDIDLATNDMNKRNKRKYIKSKEKEIKTNFEDRLKTLNITQGQLLVKLLNRQLSINCYDIVKELKNPLSAAYYQSWARLNGINLNEEYVAEENRDLERIMKGFGY
ncbi:MAG: DUF4294 domain-containing protein [Chitinophagaceae bacterium]|nr:DUF4294 domain-containing protein [Chitinophagaceae bacterium]